MIQRSQQLQASALEQLTSKSPLSPGKLYMGICTEYFTTPTKLPEFVLSSYSELSLEMLPKQMKS